MILVVVLVVLVAAFVVVVVARHYDYKESHHQDHQNHHQDHQHRLRQPYPGTVFRKQPSNPHTLVCSELRFLQSDLDQNLSNRIPGVSPTRFWGLSFFLFLPSSFFLNINNL